MISAQGLVRVHLAKRRDEIDTIFCINDLAAAAVLTEVMSIGMRVPQDLLLIGFDGVVKLPGVWTAVADVRELAAQSVASLQRQIAGDRSKEPAHPGHVVLHTPGATA